MKEYQYNNKTYPIEIIKKNNKNTYIRVKNGIIIITTNYFVTLKSIEKLVNTNKETINKMIESDIHKNIKEDSNKLSLFGIELEIVYGYDFNLSDGILYIKDIKQLNKFINKQIEIIFKERLNYWYNKYEEKIPFPNLKIRKMTSRWGVCNLKNNNVTLNYDLYKFNTKYLDYVIVHELSHFIHPNHSTSFWNQVGKYYPEYKTIRKYLRKREKD